MSRPEILLAELSEPFQVSRLSQSLAPAGSLIAHDAAHAPAKPGLALPGHFQFVMRFVAGSSSVDTRRHSPKQ